MRNKTLSSSEMVSHALKIDIKKASYEEFCKFTSIMVKNGSLLFCDYVFITNRDFLTRRKTENDLSIFNSDFKNVKINWFTELENQANKEYSAGNHENSKRYKDILQKIKGFEIESYQKQVHNHENDCQNTRITIPEKTFSNILSKDLKEMMNHYEKVYYENIKSLNIMLETRDPYVAGHSERVAYYAMLIANGIDLSNTQKVNLLYSAMFHDIGKIFIPQSILNKPGRLTSEEYAEIKKHPETGCNILRDLNCPDKIFNAVLHHHERYDGKGYPDGLKGEQINLLSRIISIADSFDAMTSNRAYREALSFEEAKRELINGRRTQFDPKLVLVFLNEVKNGTRTPLREEVVNPHIERYSRKKLMKLNEIDRRIRELYHQQLPGFTGSVQKLCNQR